MLQVKKLKRPSKRSGKKLSPGEVSEWKKWGVKIVNTGTQTVYVDCVTPKKSKK